MLASHLDKLGLPAVRIDRILHLPSGRVLEELEGIRSSLLVKGFGSPLGDDCSRGPAGEKALEGLGQRFGQLDVVLGGRRHCHGLSSAGAWVGREVLGFVVR